MKLNLGVIYGGPSTEHDISIISAVQAMNNIDTEKYNIIPLYLSKDSIIYTGEDLLKMESYRNLEELQQNSTRVYLTKKDNEFVLYKDSIIRKIIAKIDIVLPIMHGYNTEDGTIAGFLETLGMPKEISMHLLLLKIKFIKKKS